MTKIDRAWFSCLLWHPLFTLQETELVYSYNPHWAMVGSTEKYQKYRVTWHSTLQGQFLSSGAFKRFLLYLSFNRECFFSPTNIYNISVQCAWICSAATWRHRHRGRNWKLLRKSDRADAELSSTVFLADGLHVGGRCRCDRWSVIPPQPV